MIIINKKMMKMMMLWRIILKVQRKLEKKKEKEIFQIIYLKKIKIIPLLSNIKNNNKNIIPNSQNLNKSLTFPQISNDHSSQPIYGQILVYYNPFRQAELDLSTESNLWLFNLKNLLI